MYMIRMEQVQKTYGTFQFQVSMEIPQGRITGFVGKNGAGKSTAIKLILGLIRPEAGKVQVFGIPAEKLTPSDKQEIGVSLAEAGFSVQLTVQDIEKILGKMYPKFNAELFQRKCREFRIPYQKKLKEFSTGMKAKLRVLIALTHGARLLVLDEPTAGMDVESRQEVLDLLREYMAEDETRTLLITSHISSDLETLCDDIYLIHDGKILLNEETDQILDHYGILKVSEEQFGTLDQEYLIKCQKEPYGYACFTKDKQYYQENYPGIVVEQGGIDELILMMTGGYR